MSTSKTTKPWQQMRTEETKAIEKLLKKHFKQVDAYRYNSASIRIPIIDRCFAGKSQSERERMVDPILDTLPEDTQADIMLLLTLTPEELDSLNRDYLVNLEFEDPGPPMAVL